MQEQRPKLSCRLLSWQAADQNVCGLRAAERNDGATDSIRRRVSGKAGEFGPNHRAGHHPQIQQPPTLRPLHLCADAYDDPRLAGLQNIEALEPFFGIVLGNPLNSQVPSLDLLDDDWPAIHSEVQNRGLDAFESNVAAEVDSGSGERAVDLFRLVFDVTFATRTGVCGQATGRDLRRRPPHLR
jgi:hypothetical protein